MCVLPCKEETAYHTKFKSLIEVAKSLGCSYFSELTLGRNANYTSHRIIDEFITVLSVSKLIFFPKSESLLQLACYVTSLLMSLI